MLKNIVCTNCQISISPFIAANPQITCQKGFKADGKEIYYGKMILTYTNIVDASGGICPTLTINIDGSAQHNKVNGQAVILENDNGQATGQFTNSSTGATYFSPVTATIISAGQMKVKGS